MQSRKALASAFDVNIRDLEYEESEMINELLGKDVTIALGMSTGEVAFVHGLADDVTGTIVEIQAPWLKLMVEKNKPIYINISHIKRIMPQ